MVIVLGVSVMDADHAHMEALLQRVDQTSDAALPGLLTEIEAETRAHFGREQDLMQSAGVPILHCHIEKHEQFLAEFERGHRAVKQNDMPGLRRFLSAYLPELLNDHIGTVDRITSGFLQGC